MSKKDPVRGMQAMDDYSPEESSSGSKAMNVVKGATLAGIAIPPYLRVSKYEREKSAKKESDKSALENQKEYGMKKGGKVKKYADGGITTGQVQQPTYPFYGNQPQAGGQNGGMNQTFNMQPQANIDPNQQQQRFKKGGKVSSASSRADGCCVRGKTRA